MIHKLLERQLKRLRRKHKAPEDLLENLIQIVSNTYEESDQERYKKDRTVATLTEEITEANKQILAKSEAYISAILENAADGIVLTNTAFEITAFNLASQKIFGYCLEEVQECSLNKLIAEETIERFEEVLKDYQATKIFNQPEDEYDIQGCHKSGRTFPMEMTISEISLADETFYFTRFTDVSERKAFEQELINARLKAEAAAQAKSQFLSNMSHEIRTPMNAVLGLTRLLIDDDPRPEQLENLNIIKFSGDNLLVIINDILDFSKIEAGKIDLEEIDFSLKNLTTSIRESLIQKAKDKKIAFKVNIDSNIPEQIVGDPVRLTQVITNLANNAIKFTEKGSVQVNIDLVKEDAQNLWMSFSVKDTGIGIPREKQALVFESFSQSEASTTRKYGGTGLGLAITKRLLKLMGTEIKLESEAGVGSNFYFEIRLSRSQKTLEEKKEEEAKSNKINFTGLEGIHVLLVEDNKINQIVASNYLRKWKIKFEVADNGKIAVEKVKDQDFDLVLMDLHMPVMDGYTATRAIRAFEDPKYQYLPIIALTASALNTIRHEVKQTGMNNYVSKPFKPEELYTTMQYYLKNPEKITV